MAARGRQALIRLLAEPDRVPDQTLAEWDLVIPQARRSGLLGRLHHLAAATGRLATIPAPPRRHLEAERALTDKHRRDVGIELRSIKRALGGLGVPVVLLKGAAYVAAGLPPARGRVFNDIDIMVPADALDTVERELLGRGWHFAELDAYDERYYRRWMHQIPPLTNAARQTAIDVHHTIVARTTRLKLTSEKLFAAALPVPGDDVLRMLAPADMILHSATHLLNEGKFDRGLRDLDDINLLLRHFGADPAFWPLLVERACELDLRRPLFYALRYAAALLGTPVPPEIRAAPELAPPNAALRRLMDVLFERALCPGHPSCRDALSSPALFMLYLRAHWLLMPPHILLPHLLRKAYTRRFEDA
jgi:hypothetical protein